MFDKSAQPYMEAGIRLPGIGVTGELAGDVGLGMI